jgi:nicotinate-nucleotide--dimethylbenzimidazole phosphoribosyltransferase
MNPLTHNVLDRITTGLEPPSETWRDRARAHLDTLTKPLGSLGRLEDLAAQIVAIRQDAFAEPLHKAVYIFAADHGVTAEGVSAYPREVTHQMVLNFLAEGAAINVLARLHQVALRVVDVGVDALLPGHPSLLSHKIARGSSNMLHSPAMTDQELARAFAVGELIAAQAATAGQNMIAIGEMGIGNTTSASAITCALTGAVAAIATGRGTGIQSTAHEHKIAVVDAVLRKHGNRNPLEILRCMGGLEIAAMTATIIAAARHKSIVVIDGFISTAAAALAVALAPHVRGYLIAGHRSQEPGHALLLQHLDLQPVLSLDMRLGEGTGAVLAMPVLESALALYTQMATFASAGVSEETR